MDVDNITRESLGYPQRAGASVEGEAPSGFAGGGGDASPWNRWEVSYECCRGIG